MLGRLLQEAASCSEAGVGESDVDATEPFEALMGKCLLLLPFGDVALHGQCSLRTAELLGQRLKAIGRTRR